MSDVTKLVSELAKVRQAYINNTPVRYCDEPLTDVQRAIVRHDSGKERSYPFAPTNQRPESPLPPMEQDHRYVEYLRHLSEERRSRPGYGILRRMVEANNEHR